MMTLPEEDPTKSGNMVPQIHIEQMPLMAALYDWEATGARPVPGEQHGSALPTLYADDEGLLNPYGPHDLEQTKLRHEGVNQTNDTALLRPVRQQLPSGEIKITWKCLAGVRGDNKKIALPGGFHDPTDASRLLGAIRELGEEANVTLSAEQIGRAQRIFAGPTQSSRATTRKWIETEVYAIQLSEEEGAALEFEAGDDLDDVLWADLEELASGRVGDLEVSPSHLAYFQHLHAALVGKEPA